ncbi:hypothetical protein JHK84_050114 [Glycine max]|nr:hypothetical protein JHK84_050114 [Glycine max]
MSEDEFLRGKVLREQQIHSFMKLVNMTFMKVLFIASSLAIVWCMHFHPMVRRSYDRELDTFRHYFLVGASFALTLILHEKFIVQEYLNHFVSTKRLMYERFALLFSMASAWLLAKLLTSSIAYNHKPKSTQNSCRTDRGEVHYFIGVQLDGSHSKGITFVVEIMA